MPDNRVAAAIEEVPWSADALERLGQLRSARDLIDYMIDRDVAECRETAKREIVAGPDDRPQQMLGNLISWEQIGKALGISRQTAWQRFHHLDS